VRIYSHNSAIDYPHHANKFAPTDHTAGCCEQTLKKLKLQD